MSADTARSLSIEQFRLLHPWPRSQRALGRSREWLWQFDLPGTPAEVWPAVGDTERTNRATGLATMTYREEADELVGAHVLAGVRHEFVERWQWSTESSIELVREYRNGFARLLRTIYRLEPGPGGRGTLLHVYFGWIPRGILGSLLVRIGMHVFERRYRALMARIGAEMEREMERATDTARATAHGGGLAAGRPETAETAGRGNSVRAGAIAVMRRPAPHLDGDRRQRIARLCEELRGRGVDAAALDRLIDLAVSADDLELDRIRVRRLARDWGLDEKPVIRAALHATRAGLLQLSWDVMCPHCRGVRQKLATLGDVPARSGCPVCAVEFGTDGPNAIEVTFRVHPSIREVPQQVYCSAQPVRRSHIRLQQTLEPGATCELATRLLPGRYRLRRRGQGPMAFLDVIDGLMEGQTVEWGEGPAPSRTEVGPAPLFRLRAAAGRAEAFVVEQDEWDYDALRPVHLFNMQDFRDLFSEEYLAAGVRLHVGEQTILFSDIVGSTRLYAEVGDPAAFIQVKKHFARIYEQVAAHSGVVVKTIGDAVMAAFSDPTDAIAAARDIHRCFPAPGGGAPRSVRLRISIHTGPCIAVNLNSGIDYFGGTVNTAAKLQRCAGAGEVVLSEFVQRAPGVAEALGIHGSVVRREVLEHDALGRLPVAIWIPTSASPAAAGARDGDAVDAAASSPGDTPLPSGARTLSDSL